jgi:hypothetical protein
MFSLPPAIPNPAFYRFFELEAASPHPSGRCVQIVKIQVLAINFLLPREELSRYERNPPGTRVLRILTQSTFLHLSNR